MNSPLKVGSFVTHRAKAGMGMVTGRVVAEAGAKYGRRYLWVNYTNKRGITFNSAFWDAVLRPSKQSSIVRPPTQEMEPQHVLVSQV